MSLETRIKREEIDSLFNHVSNGKMIDILILLCYRNSTGKIYHF